jgi:hypothetical protein
MTRDAHRIKAVRRVDGLRQTERGILQPMSETAEHVPSGSHIRLHVIPKLSEGTRSVIDRTGEGSLVFQGTEARASSWTAAGAAPRWRMAKAARQVAIHGCRIGAAR